MLTAHEKNLINSKPLVSVHIITYNQKNFIHETLLSVLKQDYENLQIVVADDGSTDGTAEVILDYARQYPEKILPLVGGPNLGITGNSNRGLSACNGKYVAFMGGDDLLLPSKIYEQVRYMEENPCCTICYHNLEIFNSETGETLGLLNKKKIRMSGDVRFLIKNGCVNGGSATMVRSENIPNNGFEPSIPVASDWLFWLEILIKSGGSICFIDKVLGRYRRHKCNVTNAKNGSYSQNIKDEYSTIMWLLYFYPEYAKELRYRLASLIRGMRYVRDYYVTVRASLGISFQMKTLILLIVYCLTCGIVKL